MLRVCILDMSTDKCIAMEGLPDEVGALKSGTTGTKSGVDNGPLAPLLALGAWGSQGGRGAV